MNPSTHNHHTTTTISPPKPTRKILSIILKPIVMSLILSLFLLFIGLAAIILLHLLLATSFLHRHRHRRRRTSPRSASLSLHDIQTHIPPFQYKQSNTSHDCSICLEHFNEGEICRAVPVCDHVFHARCVDRWLVKVPSCPVCRTRVRLEADGLTDSVVGDDETKFLWAIGVGR